MKMVSLVIWILAVPLLATAVIPEPVSYQGFLRDSSGVPLDTTVQITFRLHDELGNPGEFWTETHPAVVVQDGFFNVRLGSITPLDYNSIADITTVDGGALSIQVGSDAVMTPQIPLSSVFYSRYTGTVDGAQGGSILSDVNVNGRANIGNGNTNAGTQAFVAGQNNSANGDYAAASGGRQNRADTTYATTGGGFGNTASGYGATVGGGQYNFARGDFAAIAGGGSRILADSNSARGFYSTIGGGRQNRADTTYATTGGGFGNIASGYGSTAGGGQYNRVRGTFATIAGGGSSALADSNSAQGSQSAIGGGLGNLVTGAYAVIAGGIHNRARGDFSAIGGGGGLATSDSNYAGDNGATVAGGIGNQAIMEHSTVGGGLRNRASELGATIGGGLNNIAANAATVAGGDSNGAEGIISFVGGGRYNFAADFASTVAGGYTNLASGNYTSISGGSENIATGGSSSIGGGGENTTSGIFASAGGGRYNKVRGAYATISGGGGASQADSNSARGDASMIPGGRRNETTGRFALAAGFRAKANHDGAFVWADSSGADFASTLADQFNIRSSGGFRLYSNPGLTAGVTMAAGASGWTNVCDSTLKRNRRNVDTKRILEKVNALPIQQWSYEAQDASIEHIGPMAQDFWRLFALGDDSLGINQIDPDGIALAAIQELAKENEILKRELASQATRYDRGMAELSDKQQIEIAELRAMVQALMAEKKLSAK